MTLVVVPLTFGREVGWPAWTWIAFALGLIGFAGFLSVERSVARRGGNPLLDLDIFSPAGVKPGLVIVFIGFACYGGLIFSIALYLQSGLGFSPIRSGLVFVAYSLGFGIANLTWSKMPAAILRWVPVVGLLAMALSTALFGIVAAMRGWMPPFMLPLLLMAGIGHGLGFGPVVNQTATRIKPAYAPVLSGLVTTAVQLSIVLGLATLGTLYLASAAPSPSAAIASVAWVIAATALLGAVCAVRLAVSRPQTEAKR